jgi:hypothetical protein
MRILFVSTSITPYPDMQSIRNRFLIKGLLYMGCGVDVVTPTYNWLTFRDDFDSVDPKILSFVKTSPPVFLKLEKYLSSLKIKFFSKTFNVISNYLLFPDIFMFWDVVAYRSVVKLLKTNKYDAIITSSGSYTAHLVGMRVSKKTKIPWFAEYGDPWGLDIYGNKKRLSFFLEKYLLRTCSGMVVTTKETLSSYENAFHPTFNILYAPCGFEHTIEDGQAISETFSMCYTGVAYSGSRNLSYLILSLDKLKEKAKLFIVGSFSSSYKNQAETLHENKVDFVGRVSYSDSIKYISGCNLLIHIGNVGSMQIPGKTYIYLSSPKPILYIKQEDSKLDASYNLLKDFPGVIFADNNEVDICNAINDIYNNYEFYKEASLRRLKMEHLYDFQWSNIASSFANFIISSIVK